MKGVIYARYSSDNQREESIEGQIRENTAYAEKNGIEIIENYIDRAYSAKTDNRPEFQRMIRESANKKYDVVIVWKLDRFARNRYDSAKYKAILRKNNIKVVSATESISDGAEGIILEAVLEGMAEYYSADLAEKVTRGMTENALKCVYNGGRAVPYGYRIDEQRHYQIDPITGPVALEIFTRYADGEPAIKIVDDLNNKGLHTSYGGLFNKNSICNMIKNRNYIGEYHFRDIVIPGGVPAIVPEDIFEKAVKRLSSNKYSRGCNKARERYILSTKLVCGKCGAMLVGDCSNRKYGIYRYYKCFSAKKHKCDLKPIRKEKIEDFVIKKIIDVIFDDDTMQIIADKILNIYNTDNGIITALQTQLKTVQSSIKNIVKSIEDGASNKAIINRLDELEKEEENLLKQIKTENENKPELTKEMIWFVFDKYRNLDLKIERNREKLIDGFINKIVVFDDGRIVITFNYKDNNETATIDEIIKASEKANNCSDYMDKTPPKRKNIAPAWALFLFGGPLDVRRRAAEADW